MSIACTVDRTEPVVAVAAPRAIDETAIDAGPLTFVDAPELVAVPAEFPAFRVLAPADLKYWAPADWGEVLFNYWD